MPFAMSVIDGETTAIEYEVLWDGTPHTPWGRYLRLETEQEHARKQRPYRTLRELDDTAVAQILYDARLMTFQEVSERHHVHPTTVDYLVTASNAGLLVRR